MSYEHRPRYSVGIIACSASKRPEGINPLTLYKGSLFATTVHHASQRCDRILIMSAKYGLLDLADPIRYYDAYLGNLDAFQRAELIAKIESEGKLRHPPRDARVLSYLPEDYHALLLQALPHLQPITRRPYTGLPMMAFVRTLSNEVKNYGKEPARRGPKLSELQGQRRAPKADK